MLKTTKKTKLTSMIAQNISMKLSSIKLLKTSIIVGAALFVITGCSKATPVPESACDKVIEHAKSVLGSNAPSFTKMKAQCKAATDEARGCVMAADKPMKILQCDF